MGSEMALLFAEHGLKVSIFDVAGPNVDNFRQNTERECQFGHPFYLIDQRPSGADVSPEIKQRIQSFKSDSEDQSSGYAQLVESLGGNNARKLFVFSIKHGRYVGSP
jgi:6-phosphogluconate dehydrogenase